MPIETVYLYILSFVCLIRGLLEGCLRIAAFSATLENRTLQLFFTGRKDFTDMELRLLSADEDNLVDPDEDIIRTALTRLPKFSGGRPARAVLIHDNGKDFIQFVVRKKDGKNRNCYVQYCENQEDGADLGLYSSKKKTTEQVIKLFQRYAAGDPKWHGEVDWKPFKPKWPLYRGLRNRRQIEILTILLASGFFVFIGALGLLIPLALGVGDEQHGIGCVSLFCASLFCFSSVVWLRPAKAGVPWVASESSGGSNSHGGCSSGSCGSTGGGGGGGDGGGCGGGGE